MDEVFRGQCVWLLAACSFIRVLEALDAAGWHAYAPDWIGFGYSEKPQPRYGFDYTEQEFHTVCPGRA